MSTSHSGGVKKEISGWLEITLTGSGLVVINYASGWRTGVVDVYLNGFSQQSVSGYNTKSTVSISFSDGDVLRIGEGSDGRSGVIVLISINVTCGGEKGNVLS